MMELTPLDVRKKKDDFRKAVRGYDVAQVDAFLDIVADRLDQVVQENRRLADRLGGLGDQLEVYKEREHALNEALLTAQELREEARSQARRESALKLQEAEVRAKQLVEAAERTVRTSAGRMEELRSRRRHFLDSFRDTLRRYMDELDAEEHRLGAELSAREADPEPAAGEADAEQAAGKAEPSGGKASRRATRPAVGAEASGRAEDA